MIIRVESSFECLVEEVIIHIINYTFLLKTQPVYIGIGILNVCMYLKHVLVKFRKWKAYRKKTKGFKVS